MDEKSFRVQVRHLRRSIASLRLFDLGELAQAAEEHGTADEKDLVAALLLALETLPDDGH